MGGASDPATAEDADAKLVWRDASGPAVKIQLPMVHVSRPLEAMPVELRSTRLIGLERCGRFVGLFLLESMRAHKNVLVVFLSFPKEPPAICNPESTRKRRSHALQDPAWR
jgi:hypothetical protein